jgi:16S rRNA processing protein RimM
MRESKAFSQSEQPAGSPSTGEPVFLVIGKLRRPHGVKGEIMMDILTDFPERVSAGLTVYIGSDHNPLRIKSSRVHQNAFLVSFREYHSPEEVGELRNQMVYVPAEDRPPLPDGEFYHHQILGLRVVSESGEVLGKVIEILETGANDVYVVQPEQGPEILLPVIDPVILGVDLASGEIRVHVLPGLIPDE